MIKVAPAEIASRLGRSKKSMTRLLAQRKPRKQQSDPPKLSDVKVDLSVKRLDELVVKTDCKYTVTTELLKRSAREQASERTIRDALHSRNVWFRMLREKATITPDDVSERFKFTKQLRPGPRPWPRPRLVPPPRPMPSRRRVWLRCTKPCPAESHGKN